jgi:carboxylate-amine ligase
MARRSLGLAGQAADLGKQKEVPAVDLIRELLDFVDDVVDDLDSRKEIEHIHTILNAALQPTNN